MPENDWRGGAVRCVEVAKLVQRPDVKAALTATGTDVVVRGPKDYAALLRVEFEKWGKVVNLPDVKERFLSQGLTPVGSTPEQVSAHVREESAEVAKLVKKIGYQPQ